MANYYNGKPKWVLTEEQAALASKHRKLVFFFARFFSNNTEFRRKYPYIDEDDIISGCNLGLLQAAGHFDKDKKVKFSHYAKVCMYNQVVNDNKVARNYFKKHQATTFEVIAGYSTSRTEEFDYEGMTQEEIDAFILALPAKHRAMFEMRISGMSNKEIAEKLGCTRQYVSLVLRREVSKIVKPPNRMNPIYRKTGTAP